MNGIQKKYAGDVFVTLPCDKYKDPKGIQRKIFVKKKRKKRTTTKIRWVINFYVYYKDASNNEVVIRDLRECPISLKIGFKSTDGERLLVHFDDRDDPVEIQCDRINDPHDGYEGYGYATITEWGDPSIGWG